MKEINNLDIVWPFPAPPVCTAYWDNSAWIKFIKQYRPKNYRGGITNKKHWQQQLEITNLKMLRRLRKHSCANHSDWIDLLWERVTHPEYILGA